MSRRRKGRESGFALLWVLAAAAIIAIMLYAEMPRVAFEGQRIKEGDLIARGEQYRRAIKLFFNRFGRYPPSIEALENTNNIRFLRRRYKDPMTGKDDWRLIHVSAGGFTDSLTIKPPAPAGTTAASDLSASSSGDGTQPQPTPQRWQLQRPGSSPSTNAASGNPDAQLSGGQTDYSQQQPVPGGPVAVPGQQAYTPGQQQPGDPNAPGALQPGQPGYPLMLNGSPVGQPSSAPNQQGMPPQPGQRLYAPGGPPYNSPNYPPFALPGMPNSLIGTQTPNSMVQATGNNQSSGSSSSGSVFSAGGFGTTVGGAIGGVASKYEAQGIKVYKDHSKYNEWEFLYDPRQEIVAQGGVQVPAGTQALPGQQPGASGFSTSMGTPLGTQSGAQSGTTPATPQPGSSSPSN
jgi:type II secretory pathway pseudopilin PulG